MIISHLFLFILVFGFAYTSESSSTSDYIRVKEVEDADNKQTPIVPDFLPYNVKPLHYDLDIVTDMEKFTFEGKVSIT
jgi:hypothetical protein